MSVTALAWVTAFNLSCTGTIYVHDVSDPYSAPATRPFSETYRIDLAKRRWCVEQCTMTLPIAKVESNSLTLQDITTPTAGIQAYTVTISRETGILFSILKVGNIETRTVQQCAVAPFTGFPVLKF